MTTIMLEGHVGSGTAVLEEVVEKCASCGKEIRGSEIFYSPGAEVPLCSGPILNSGISRCYDNYSND